EEKIAHFPRRAAIAGGGPDGGQMPGLRDDFRAVPVIGAPAAQRHPGDRGDGWQGLAAEAEPAYVVNVLAELGGAMARKGQRQLVRRHAGSVVAHPDQVEAATGGGDLDAPGAGVERILEKLLDDARRALDHLAGRDLIDDRIGKLPDAHDAVTRPPAPSRGNRPRTITGHGAAAARQRGASTIIIWRPSIFGSASTLANSAVSSRTRLRRFMPSS